MHFVFFSIWVTGIVAMVFCVFASVQFMFLSNWSSLLISIALYSICFIFIYTTKDKAIRVIYHS